MEDKIDDPRGRLTTLSKYTQGWKKELINPCIQKPPEVGYQNARKLLDKRHGDPQRIHASYQKEIKNWLSTKYGDAKVSSSVFSTTVTVLEMEEIGISCNLLSAK